MKSDYRERAIHFLYSIIPFLTRHSSIYDAVEEYNVKRHRAVKYYCGSVRDCLVTSDYVVKWDSDRENNYYIGTCTREKTMWEIAKKSGFAYLFAEPTIIEIYGKLYEIMPRITPAWDEDSDCEDWYDVMDDDERAFIHKYRMDEDLHAGNYGLDNFGKFKIFDYAYWRD